MINHFQPVDNFGAHKTLFKLFYILGALIYPCDGGKYKTSTWIAHMWPTQSYIFRFMLHLFLTFQGPTFVTDECHIGNRFAWRFPGKQCANIMTSSNGNIFRVTGHLCGEFTGHRWIPFTKASDAALWYFLWSAWINGWVHNSEVGDLRCHHSHYGITVVWLQRQTWFVSLWRPRITPHW